MFNSDLITRSHPGNSVEIVSVALPLMCISFTVTSMRIEDYVAFPQNVTTLSEYSPIRMAIAFPSLVVQNSFLL